MRLAVWTPLPPQGGTVAGSAVPLLAELARSVEVLAVVRDDVAEAVSAPERCTVVSASRYRPTPEDVSVYHVADDAPLHGYMHARALADPGVVVLHDPSLVSLYLRIGGGPDGAVFREEARLDRQDLGDHVPHRGTDGSSGVDSLVPLMSRRLVEASAAVVASSWWAERELSARSPGAVVHYVPEPASLGGELEAPVRDAGCGVLGLFGAPDRIARVADAIRAFEVVHRQHPGARLVVAVDADAFEIATDLDRCVAMAGCAPAITVDRDVADAERRVALMESCDAVVVVERAETGATSRALMDAFGAGRVAIVADSPQYLELDDLYCWRADGSSATGSSALAELMCRAAVDPVAARESGRRARNFVASFATYPAVAARHVEIARAVLAARHRGASRATLVCPPPALNAIASWEATTGLTEAARRAVGALVDSGVRVAMEDYDYGAPRLAARWPASLRSLPRGRPHPVDLYFLNLNELHVVPDSYLRPIGRRRHVIASWYWELAGIPTAQHDQISRVDEIWVASQFVASVFRGYTSTPVHVVPCVVEPVAEGSLSRADFGLPEDRCLYFFNFDASSTLARKNPGAVVEAYRRAFSTRERAEEVGLVMKTLNLSALPEARLMLESAVASVGGTVVDADLPPAEVAALTAACDVYVSLHRGEGFGLGIAEAMALGRPAIATAYSGNLDFMDVSNSCPVGYAMTAVDGGQLRFNPDAEHVYTPGQLWAEPDVDEAARRMRFLFENPHVRERLGEAGAATVRSMCSSMAVGARMRELLAGR